MTLEQARRISKRLVNEAAPHCYYRHFVDGKAWLTRLSPGDAVPEGWRPVEITDFDHLVAA